MRKPKPLASPKYVGLFIIILLIMLFLLGGVVSDKCIEIGSHTGCWKTTPIRISSEYCPTEEECIASPEAQQNNAVVSLLLDACNDAKLDDYVDASLNMRINDVLKDFTGYDITAQELCESPGTLLVYRSYE
ncbi:hypothetical protein ACFLQN_01055 [Candidatus Aenigmatarchaeota archaeon]